MMLAESIHGTLRALFLKPRIGAFLARQISVFTASAILFAIACWFSRWIGASSTSQRIAVGFVWLALTLFFDVGLGHYAFGRSWELLGEDFNLLHGGMFPIGLVLLTGMPLIAQRLAKTERRRQ